VSGFGGTEGKLDLQFGDGASCRVRLPAEPAIALFDALRAACPWTRPRAAGPGAEVLASCTQQWHSALKLDAARWAVEVEPIGEIVVHGGAVVQLANCRRCHSTLAVQLAQPAAREPGL
jgi:hypothetical protein